MAEQADAERIAELNRNKERYEQAQEEQRRGEERQLADEVRENKRRLQLEQQRRDEERREREQQQHELAERKKQQRHEEFAREREVEREKRIDREKHNKQIAADLEEARRKHERESEQEKLREARAIKKRAEENAKKPQVAPMLPFGQAAKRYVKDRVSSGVTAFKGDLARPVKGIQEGRRKRAVKQQTIPDPLAGLTATQQQQRVRRHRPREGTGFLFSEGFFNPPARAAPKKGKKGSRKRRSPLDFDMGSMVL